jgi:hypothetical protein
MAGPVGISDIDNEINVFRSHDLRLSSQTQAHLYRVKHDSEDRLLTFDEYRKWLQSQGKTKRTVRDTVNYSKRFAGILATGDASPLLTQSPRNRHHALTALANLAKYTGRYQEFQQMKQHYGLKWTNGGIYQSNGAVLQSFLEPRYHAATD